MKKVSFAEEVFGKRWVDLNPDERRRYQAEWRKRRGDKERMREWSRKYWAKRRADPEWQARSRAYGREYTKKNRSKLSVKYRKYRLMVEYGLTLEDYDAMLLRQRGRCALCGAKRSGRNDGAAGALHVDHCHATGVVRGLLCHNCNMMLGHAKDNIELLRKAMEYLQAHKPRSGGDAQKKSSAA